MDKVKAMHNKINLFSNSMNKTGLTNDELIFKLELIDAASTTNTEKTYQNAIKQFVASGHTLPATSVTLIKFMKHLRDKNLKPSTIENYITAVSVFQTKLGFFNPINSEISQMLKGYRRTGASSKKKGERLSKSELFQIAKSLYENKTPEGLRNRALFLTTFYTLSRTSEIASFTFENTTNDLDQITFYVSTAKGQQDGQGLEKIIPKLNYENSEIEKWLCPWTAIQEYIANLPYRDGSYFKRLNRNGKFLDAGLSHRSIGALIKSILIDAGINEERVKKINGHSLRHTMGDLGSQSGISGQALQKLGGWNSISSISTYTSEHNTTTIKTIAENLKLAHLSNVK